MVKEQLVKQVQVGESYALTNKAAEEVVNNVLKAIKDGVRKDGKVQIVGFGTWFTRVSKAKVVANPNTGKPMKIPSKKRIKFRASPMWKK